MCLAIPGRISAIKGFSAIVETMGISHEINIQLIENPTVGDYVLIHAGFAIEKIHEQYYSYLEERIHEYIAYSEHSSRDE